MFGGAVKGFLYAIEVKLLYQLKINCFIYKTFSVSLMLTTKQNPAVDVQKIEQGIKAYHCRKSTIHKGRQKEREKQPENNKITLVVSPYLSIITLNIKGLNSPSKCIQWQNRLKNKTNNNKKTISNYMLPTRDLYQL